MRRAALVLCMWSSVASAAPRAIDPPGPIAVDDAVIVPGVRIERFAAPSFAAPHRMLTVGDRLFLATDGGLAELDAGLHEGPRLVVDELGSSLGSVADLALVNGELWAATARGVARVDPQHGRVRGWLARGNRVFATALARCNETTDELAVGQALHGGEEIVTVIACANGTRLVGTDSGLRRGDQTIGAGPVTSIAGGSRAIAFGSVGDGLYVVGRDGALSHPLSVGRVWAVAAHGDGWLVAIDDTLVRLDAQGRTTGTRAWIGPHGLITALAPDGDNLWVGTFDDGLYRWSGGAYARVPTADRRITALLADDGLLYVGTGGGLFLRERDGRIDRVADPQKRFERHTSTLRRLGTHVLAGAYPGAVLIDGAARRYLTGRSQALAAGEEPMFATTVFGATRLGNALWLATQDGVERHDEHGTAVFASIGGVVPDDWVNDVVAVGEDVVFALGDQGVGWIGPSGTRIHRAHLPTATGGLAALADRALLAGDDGVVVLRGDSAEIVRYGFDQGIDITVGALAFDEPRDRVWLGGVGGVLRIDAARRQLVGAKIARGER